MKSVLRSRALIFMAALVLLAPVTSQATPDARVAVELPSPMRAHMLKRACAAICVRRCRRCRR